MSSATLRFLPRRVGLSLGLSLGLLLSACGQQNAHSNASTTTTASTKTTPSVTVVDNAHSDIRTALQSNLTKAGVDVVVTSVTPSDLPDFYLAQIDGVPPVFTNKTGTLVFQGDLLQLGGDTPINVAQNAQAHIAKAALAGVDPQEMIIFSPKGETKAAIYVFSDPTCHYCQLLHKDMAKINAQGIEVRYLAWPRSESIIPLTQNIWCSADRHQAMNDAKAGKTLPTAHCDNPVERHIALGHSLGVSGTPAIFTQGGQQIGGYLPADELAKQAISNQ